MFPPRNADPSDMNMQFADNGTLGSLNNYDLPFDPLFGLMDTSAMELTDLPEAFFAEASQAV